MLSPVIQELKRHDPFTSSYCGLLAIAYLEVRFFFL